MLLWLNAIQFTSLPSGPNCWHEDQILQAGVVMHDGNRKCQCPEGERPYWMDPAKVEATCTFEDIEEHEEETGELMNSEETSLLIEWLNLMAWLKKWKKLQQLMTTMEMNILRILQVRHGCRCFCLDRQINGVQTHLMYLTEKCDLQLTPINLKRVSFSY